MTTKSTNKNKNKATQNNTFIVENVKLLVWLTRYILHSLIYTNWGEKKITINKTKDVRSGITEDDAIYNQPT